eukprot:TRINITY_DN4540_c0_g1_i1.p1 TRINITY_DN4540_c0_g1~~TRINITY_DN4540_c0_g1_i1.p1  ORF type:complete len:305 (+),score=77.45 TRINITY_DN4540_c0_g1_i1:73-915(+)
MPPIIECTGALWAGLWHQIFTSGGECSGLIFGTVERRIYSEINDAESAKKTEKTAIQMHFFAPFSGEFPPDEIDFSQYSPKAKIVGWYRFRRHFPLRPTSSELFSHHRLQKSIKNASFRPHSGPKNPQNTENGPQNTENSTQNTENSLENTEKALENLEIAPQNREKAPLLLLLLSDAGDNDADIRFSSQIFQISAGNRVIRERKMAVLNMGRGGKNDQNQGETALFSPFSAVDSLFPAPVFPEFSAKLAEFAAENAGVAAEIAENEAKIARIRAFLGDF